MSDQIGTKDLESFLKNALTNPNLLKQVKDTYGAQSGLSDRDLSSVAGGAGDATSPADALAKTADALGTNPTQDQINAAATDLAGKLQADMPSGLKTLIKKTI